MEIISKNSTAVNTTEVEFKHTPEEFEAAVQSAFLRKRKNITVPGFRKGKATRKLIETHYGEGVFYDDAINQLYRSSIDDVIKEVGKEVVDIAKIEVTEVNKENGVVYKAEFTTKPEVNIDGYKGLEVTKIVNTVTDEDVGNELKARQDRNARMIDIDDRAVQKGDIITFDFEGFSDGKAFEGGKAENFDLEVGSGQFIPGFEEQLEGKEIGEKFDVNVTFPEDYGHTELAGKEAVFKCLVHEIKYKELPELDDDFAKDTSEFDTIEELKNDIKEKLRENAEKTAEQKVESDLNNMLIEKLEGEIPSVMYEHRIDDIVKDWEFRNRYQGISVKDYLDYAGITMEQFRENFKEPAEKQVKLRLALEKIAELESIEVSDEELEQHYADLAEEHKMEIDKVKRIIPIDNLKEDIKVEKAEKLVKDNAKIAE